VLVEEGQRVEAGEVLAYIDDATEQAQLELARAQ
jgi:multidrug efflux pump subunit AcrA (membrane-fusion protein)